MSIGGPSALGTLLVHRLDSVLGTTLSQQANLVTGARPDAVTQPGSAERPDPAQNEVHRQTRDGVDRATAQTEQQTRQAINRAKLDTLAAEILAARSAPNTATTKSAPTSLGHAARTILALLANHPDQPAAVQGKAPLLIANPRSALLTTAGGLNTAAGNAARTDSAATSVRGQNINASTAASVRTGTATITAASASAATAASPSVASVPTQLAQALAQALQGSGIFYESHLNNLAYGKHSLTQLRQEPQAQVARGPEGAAPGNSPTTAAPTSNANAPAHLPAAAETLAAPQSQRGEAPASHTTTNTGSTIGSSNTGTPLPVPGLDPQTHQIVRQQLEVLANQTFAWRGEAWPDAPMEWEINRREPSRDDTLLSPEAEHWATRINIQLPVLGNVQARLTLAGQQVVMQLIAPESSTLLKEHAEALRERYSAIGMQLSQIAVADNAWDAAASIVHGSTQP
ncbi:flagellar hook-length control protein FliK [Pollutimonas subterranea]|uniref:Flagellar hook-length control protein FliK n=1 Tax=Pollutimonas subterranea TaxID=2045210 RepID=A0A2N4TYY8_9BURK|nr:flagellar hook-length control protein FliK [Pollutimonas subterranea]PLC47986.1 flagellar hook-length control protein FliK [Pollutimonas subterranea]